MRKYLQMVIVLGLAGFISGTSLAFVYNYTIPLIEAYQKGELLKTAIFNIIPYSARYEMVIKDDEEFFKVFDKDDNLLGYVFTAEGNGYQGNIKMIAGIMTDLSTLHGIDVLESVETPGLGGEIASDKFKSQFKNLEFIPMIKCIKEEKKEKNEIQAITGATISSQSVAKILNEKTAKVIEILKR